MDSSFASGAIMEEASINIVVWNTSENNWETEIQSVAAAIQNFLLKAYSLNLGSLWIGDIFYAYNETIAYFKKSWKLTRARVCDRNVYTRAYVIGTFISREMLIKYYM
jgi:nitroreductase